VKPGQAQLLAGGGLAAVLVGMAALSFFWTPYPPSAIDVLHRLAAPSAAHWLGTDPFGRDELSLLMAGARTSLVIALVAVLVGASVGIPLGAAAAALGRWPEQMLMRAADLVFAFPALLTAVMIAALAGPGTANAMLAIGIFTMPVFARVTRASARSVLEREFVAAARAIGRSEGAVLLRHVLPNIAPQLLVQASIQFALAIVADAGLAYVGLGTQPPQPSWGRMLADAQTYVFDRPALAIFPGLAVTAAVLGFNLLGDGLRDRLDPRLRRR
jgi:peptide/nickel transport system permease protein